MFTRNVKNQQKQKYLQSLAKSIGSKDFSLYKSYKTKNCVCLRDLICLIVNTCTKIL